MSRNVRLLELLLGIEGLALLRHLYDGTDEDAARRVTEIRALLSECPDDSESMAAADPLSGYDAWASVYDDPGNPIIALEQPAVWGLMSQRRPGAALDAACGTGRHTRRLAGLGHRVTGIDHSPNMLDRARGAVPAASFAHADLGSVPARDATFDLVVSGLALAHVENLAGAVAEFARVLRPGGHLVMSVLHPLQCMLGWHAPFKDANGTRHFVREHPHRHADYLTAFTHAGLQVEKCIEPRLGAPEIAAKRRASRAIPDAVLAAYLDLPAVLIWDVEKQ